MKRYIPLAWCCLVGSALQAQSPRLTVSEDKTTSLVFPYPVRHVDRGTRDVLVLPLKQAGNILLVKAACAGFRETTLSVVTGDGSLYTFLVSYSRDPATLSYELPARSAPPLSAYARSIRDNPPVLRGVKDRAWGMRFTLMGLYIKDGVLYCHLSLENQSAIDYPVDYLQFRIKDQGRGKRTSVQERELAPLQVEGTLSCVRAFSRQVVVAALKSFTLPRSSRLLMEVGEKEGGRHLTLKVSNRRIVRALPLPGGE